MALLSMKFHMVSLSQFFSHVFLRSSSPCGAGRSFIPNQTLLLSDLLRPDSPGFTVEKKELKHQQNKQLGYITVVKGCFFWTVEKGESFRYLWRHSKQFSDRTSPSLCNIHGGSAVRALGRGKAETAGTRCYCYLYIWKAVVARVRTFNVCLILQIKPALHHMRLWIFLLSSKYQIYSWLTNNAQIIMKCTCLKRKSMILVYKVNAIKSR